MSRNSLDNSNYQRGARSKSSQYIIKNGDIIVGSSSSFIVSQVQSAELTSNGFEMDEVTSNQRSIHTYYY
ncbi:hypothetical protein DFA_10640 [Cavenderia fasciculata]|uniref:Uncharacterized protein n=1 Tax=Cavenderia fasciculata TaxID=261658 RepID=F4QAZ5_CACFS|nr:uncharacterized protein DFA_10640 [Cavenderia fasciculata]EGG14767.1 hypothetical protein DFA_10640 [Cavenderia fasciculata]|eukprot:XP_004351283.1 hypothetical protein DFA_10640 [Cavenderia fasciculata]